MGWNGADMLRSGCFVCKIGVENLWSKKCIKLSCEVIVSKKYPEIKIK